MGFVQGKEWNCDCIQIYLTPSRTWKVLPLELDEIKQFHGVWKHSGVKTVIAHIPFLVNIASENKELRQRSIERLLLETKIASKLHVSYLVFHPGSSKSKKDGIERIIEGLNFAATKKYDFMPTILLETMSGQGNMLCSQFEDLTYILSKVDNPKRFGVCLDTAHVFISGYNFTGYRGYERVIDLFDKIVGLDEIKAIHLNDSKTAQGSHNDRHAAIGEGRMGLQVFHALVRDKRFEHVPKILEIPERDEKSEKTLRLLRELQYSKYIQPTVTELSTQNVLEEYGVAHNRCD